VQALATKELRFRAMDVLQELEAEPLVCVRLSVAASAVRHLPGGAAVTHPAA
jgi:hypothetical protein